VRYAPQRAFPPYAFLPGRDPHPTRDPAGHSHGLAEAAADYRPASDWRANEDYLFGVDLYNHGFLWEAHEAWEGLWHAAKHDQRQAEFLQGLIQCAAACLKVPMRQPAGLEKLARLGTQKLERVAHASGGRYMGLELPAFVQALRAFATSAPEDIEARPRIALG
jgi:predicted metal-dependent hydrolase